MSPAKGGISVYDRETDLERVQRLGKDGNGTIKLRVGIMLYDGIEREYITLPGHVVTLDVSPPERALDIIGVIESALRAMDAPPAKGVGQKGAK